MNTKKPCDGEPSACEPPARSEPPAIGGVRPAHPFLLAPLAGVTDAPFRRLCREMGAAMVYAEMVSAKGLCYGDRNTERLLRVYADEKPVAYQIFGKEPEIMASAAELLESRENAVLDINMGCPVPKIVRNGEGAALLRTPELVSRITETVVRRTKKPVTVKIRTGWDANSVNAVEIAKRIEAAGAAAVAVHGRTREQFYGGHADRNVIRRVKAALRIPVIGNGDVRDARDASALLRDTGCDYVMIARGALGNPWIFRDIARLRAGDDVTPRDARARADMAERHLAMLIEEKGEYVAVREMRKHAAWYMKGVRGSSELRGRLNAVSSAAEFREVFERFRVDLSAEIKQGR